MSIDTWAEVTVTQPPSEDELVRNNRYNIGGKWYTRASKWAEAITDDSALTLWKQRMVALGITDRRDLRLAVAAARDDKKKLNELCGEARKAAQANEGRDIGTSLHSLVETINRGGEVGDVGEWNADLAAYRDALAVAGIEVLADMIERVVVCEALGVAGRFDLAVRVPGYDLPLIADLKTGGYLSWLSFAVQESLYARAEKIYDRTTGTLVDKPPVDQTAGLIIHLPEGQGRCDLYTVDLVAGWEAAQVCRTVRNWRNRKGLSQPYNPAQTLATKRAFLRKRVERIRDAGEAALKELALRWPPDVPTFKQSDDHDEMALSLIDAAVTQVESIARLAFVPADAADGLVALDAERMIARLQALPSDLLAAVEAGAAGKIPNLRKTHDIRREHLDALEQLVGPVEAEHERRKREVRECAGVEFVDLDDPKMIEAAVWYVRQPTHDEAMLAGSRMDVDSFTDAEAARWAGMCAALAAGQLAWVADGDGWRLERREEAVA